MKQNYVKPHMIVERFALTQSIASGGCGAPAGGSTLGEPNQWSKSTCGWKLGDDILFMFDAEHCFYKIENDGEIEGVCYNNPDGGTSIFGSF